MVQSPFLNPLFLGRILKSYLSDVDRVWHMDMRELIRYQDTRVRQLVHYAYTVPLYHQRYKQAGIHPHEIKGVADVNKLPIISKDDLRHAYPDGILPPGFNTQHGFLLSTSGSTGKPVFVYCDQLSAIKRLEGFIRSLKAYGGSWQKSRICLIIDDDPRSVEYTTFTGSLFPFLRRFLRLHNIKYIPLSKTPEEIIEELDCFQPEFLSSDPDMLRKLASLKNSGVGQNINPCMVFSGGAMLDDYTRGYVQQAFNCELRDIYGTTEAGPLAYECIHGGCYHVHSDFVYLEIVNEQQEPVATGQPGHLLITQLYPQATPIIRYSGIEDIVVPSDAPPQCEITTQMIENIQGRKTDVFVFADGTTMSPLKVTGIPAKIMEKYHTYKIKQFQIIQHTKQDIEVRIVIDTRLRHLKPPTQELIRKLQHEFTHQIGHGVTVRITETEAIEPEKRSDYVQVAKSLVKQKEPREQEQ